jgi:signal transduction histidine kinase
MTALRLILEQHREDCRDSQGGLLDRALALIREIDADIDDLACKLQPRVLGQIGLAAALRQLVQRSADSAFVDAECRCHLGREQLLSPDQQETVYRVAQEALHNVLSTPKRSTSTS